MRGKISAQDALVKGSVAEQAQIQSQLDSMVNGEQSQIVSLRAQLTEAKYNLEQTGHSRAEQWLRYSGY